MGLAQYTPPGTPQHNGVSERRNRTLLDMVRSMLSFTDLPYFLWGYALLTSAHLLNKIPSCRNPIPSAAEAAYGTRIDPEKFFCSKFCPNWPALILAVSAVFLRQIQPPNSSQIQQFAVPKTLTVHWKNCTVLASIELLIRLVSTAPKHSETAPTRS